MRRTTKISPIRIALVAAIVFVVTVASAFVFAQSQTPVYVAEVEVLVDLGTFGSRAQADRELATYEVIGSSRVVLEEVADRTGLSIEEVSGGFSIDVLGASSVLSIRGRHEDSATALAIVGAAADAFVDLVSANTSAALRGSIQLEIDSLVETLAEIDERLAEIDSSQSNGTDGIVEGRATAEEQRFLAESETVLARMSVLQDRLFELELGDTSQLGVASMLGEPRLLGQDLTVGDRQAMAIGAMVGLLLASLVGAVLWQMLPRPETAGQREVWAEAAPEEAESQEEAKPAEAPTASEQASRFAEPEARDEAESTEEFKGETNHKTEAAVGSSTTPGD